MICSSLTKMALMQPSPRYILRRNLVYLTAAAALTSTLTSSPAYAFAPPVRITTRSLVQQYSPKVAFVKYPVGGAPFIQKHAQTTRLYSYKKEEEGILEKAGNAVKSILPKSWFQSKEEKQAAIERKRVKDDVSGGLKEVLKDAPLPIRMVGGMIAPLLSKVASSLAETMGEQQQQMEQLLDDARSYLVRDPATAKALGEPIIVQSPFSQSSSTSNINGKVTSQIQASFQVQGSTQNGVASMTATQDGIASLTVQVGGRTLNVNLSKKGPPGGGSGYPQSNLGKNPINKDDIIDVEFTEKK